MVFGVSLGAAVFVCGSPAGASSTTDLQAEATQLSQQLIQEQLQVDTLEHQYELDSITVQQDAGAVAAVQRQVTHDRAKVRADRLQLTNEAVASYVNSGSLNVDPSLQLFSGGQQQEVNRNEYQHVAIGDLTVTLALLHTDEGQLQASEATLTLRIQKDRAAQNGAAQATARAQAVADELSNKESLVKGQLEVAIDQQRQQLTQTAVATRAATGAISAPTAASGGGGLALSDPPLPPFLACVRQTESGGDYGAVSPDGLYMGAFQFAQGTWNEAAQLAGLPQLVGVAPNTASPAEQDTLAITLYDADGEQPWVGDCGS
jgi:hypothetical protein